MSASGRIAVAALLTLCQCSFLFDVDTLRGGGTAAPDVDAGADEGQGDAQALDAPGDAPALDAASDAEAVDLENDGVPDTGGTDATLLDVSPDTTLLDTAPDNRVVEAGVDESHINDATDSGPNASGLDAATDSPADTGGVDAAAETGGASAPTNDGGFDGFLAFYPFAETSGTTSVDTTGNNQPATMVGATFSPGVANNAATMDGSSEYVSLPAGIVNGLTAFSICTWVNLNAPVMQHTHIFDFGTGPTAYMFLTPNSGSGVAQFAITTSGVMGEEAIDALAAVAAGSWQHVCVTLAGTTGILYVNGVEVAKNAAMTLSPSSLGNTTQDWLGRSQYAVDPYLNGKVDQFRIYSRALSASEVLQLFQMMD